MRDQAARLTDAVAVFRLGAGAAAVAPAPARAPVVRLNKPAAKAARPMQPVGAESDWAEF
jgi:hypothetical protein